MIPIRPHSVLSVEDEADFQKEVVERCQELGLKTHGVRSSDGAWALLQACVRFCVILLDLRIPSAERGRNARRENAKTLLMRIRTELGLDRDLLPVIVVTGEGTVPAATEMMQLAANDFVVKPLEGDVLESKITRWLSQCCERQHPKGCPNLRPVPSSQACQVGSCEARLVLEGALPTGRKMGRATLKWEGKRCDIQHATFRALCDLAIAVKLGLPGADVSHSHASRLIKQLAEKTGLSSDVFKALIHPDGTGTSSYRLMLRPEEVHFDEEQLGQHFPQFLWKLQHRTLRFPGTAVRPTRKT